MKKISVVSTWLGVLAVIVIVLASIAHAAKADRVGRSSGAYVAIHGVVIPPFDR
jgi:hypothetical protein